MLQALRSYFKPYTVHSCDFQGVHHCATMADALSWAACYPATDVVSIMHRGQVLALRHGSR